MLPIFHGQIARGEPVTLTDPEMTRFIMTVEEAVRLVIESSALACGGEVFITKMPVARIADLAEVMIRALAPRYGRRPEDVEIKVIGAKPGEKLYEELIEGWPDHPERARWEHEAELLRLSREELRERFNWTPDDLE